MSTNSSRRRLLRLLAATATIVLASSAPALAAGQEVCVGGPSSPLVSPGSDGQCKRNYTLTTLASQSDLTALKTKVSALESDNASLKTKVSALESDNARLQTKVSALEDKLSKVSYDATGMNGKPTLKIDGANLQVVSGSAATDGAINGLGNLFIGYNENAGTQTGSHNLILGSQQTFTSYGGVIAGHANTLSGAFANVFGQFNTATAFASSVTGGIANTASGRWSSVLGGQGNTASGDGSSVSGGNSNTTTGIISSVSGGYSNTASGSESSILGGHGITVSAQYGTSP